jgi:hypothetical protein
MTTSTPTTRTRAPMSPMRKTALAAGLLYLATFVFSFPAAFGFYDGVLHDRAFVLGAGSASGVAWGALFEIITALTGIATAVVLYPVVKRWGQNAALGFVASRTIEAAMLFVGVLSVLSVVTLRQDPAGADAAGLTTAAHSLLAVKSWTFLLGPGIMPAINALCLGSLLYRSRLVPRIMPVVGLVGAPLLLAAAAGTLFGQFDQVSPAGALLTVPIGLWELSIGVWMTVKGFTAEAGAAEAAPVGAGAPAFRGAAA